MCVVSEEMMWRFNKNKQSLTFRRKAVDTVCSNQQAIDLISFRAVKLLHVVTYS